MKHISVVLCLLFFLFAILGCKDRNIQETRVVRYSELGPPPSTMGEVESQEPQAQLVKKRMVVFTASVSIQAEHYDTVLNKLQTIAQTNDGFVVSTNTRTSDNDAKSGEVVLRIPSAKFNQIIQLIKGLGSKVLFESTRGNDVTEEFYDFKARLENKRRIEARYREILRFAKTTQDVVGVEKALGEVRGEIETLEGKLKVLSDQVDLSTITVNIREPEAASGQDQFFFQKITSGIRNGFLAIGDVTGLILEVLIGAIPVWLLLGAGAYVFLRIRRTKKSKRAQL